MDTGNWWRTAGLALLLTAVIQPAEAQKFKVLYRFTGGAEGGNPLGRLLLRSGKLYGTTPYGGGGTFPKGSGAVFEIDLASGQETTLHTFSGTLSDGAGADAGLIADSAGNLYGTTSAGGASNYGTVFKIDSTGAMTALHSFSGSDGADPESGLVADSVGNLYGTTLGGGSSNAGTLFEVDAAGSFSTLYSFTPKLGINPDSGLLLNNGDLYGTTEGGFKRLGTVFKVNAATGTGRALYRFTGGADGGYPVGGLVGDAMGNLYGTAAEGGNSAGGRGDGVVFVINLATREEKIVHTFTGKPDGKAPYGGLVRDQQGNFYGTTMNGGTHNAGTIFKINAAGNLTILHSLTGGMEGAHPWGGLAIGPAGTLYGTTQIAGGTTCGCGTVFEIVF